MKDLTSILQLYDPTSKFQPTQMCTYKSQTPHRFMFITYCQIIEGVKHFSGRPIGVQGLDSPDFGFIMVICSYISVSESL